MLGVIAEVKVQLCGLLSLALICYFSLRRKGIILKGSYVYRQLLVVTTLCVISDIVSVISIGRAPHALQVFLCRNYLWWTILTAYISVYYIWFNISTLRKYVKHRKMVSIFVVLLDALIAFILPIKLHSVHGEFYTYGSAVTVTYIVCGSLIAVFLGMTFIFKNHINTERRNAARIWMFIEAAGSALQLFDPKVLLVSYTMALGVMILCVKIENPDAWIDRNTGAYSFQLLKEYLRELFEENKSCACVIIGQQESQLKHYTMKEEQVISIANYLSSLCEGRVFCGIGNSFILTFKTEDEARNAIEYINAPVGRNEGGLTNECAVYLIPDVRLMGNVDELFLLYQQIGRISDNSEDKITVIDAEILDRMRKYKKIQQEISEALNEDRIEVFLQPIYSTSSKRFVSAEALVRMRNSDGIMIYPSEFIPVAEASGLIGHIGDRVFEKVCGYIQEGAITRLGIEYVEVNLSIVQCEDNTLAERYEAIMRSYNIRPSAINLEITETAQMQNRKTLMQNLKDLRSVGCTFSLDDFGTGESNLNYIVEMPVDIVKFDRTMIMSYFSNQKTRLMMEYVTKMIKSMNMKIVAEGVEEAHQLDTLEKLGVDYIQGYYFSKPVSKEEFLAFIANNQ